MVQIAVSKNNYNSGNIITASDVAALKELVALECGTSRRGKGNGTSQNQSNGSLSGYYSAVNGTSIVKGQTVSASSISNITKPVYKATAGVDKSVEKGDKISLLDVVNKIVSLNGVSVTSSSHGCNASCTGLCSSGCYSGCSSCTGNCQGSCSGCRGGCSGCGGCDSACSGCQGSGCHSNGSGGDTCYSW